MRLPTQTVIQMYQDNLFRIAFSICQNREDANHITHVIVIGGTADDYGYAEYLFDKDGTYIFNNMNVSSDTPAWFVNAEKDLGVDAESLSDEAATYSVTEE